MNEKAVRLDRPKIGVAYPESADSEEIRAFSSTFTRLGIEVAKHPVPDGMEYRSGIEWLTPTLVVLFISKAYFEGFFEAAGTSHYETLKRASKRLVSWALRLRPQKITARRIVPLGPYSMSISLLFSNDTDRFKLLFDINASESEIGEAISLFLKFAETVSKGTQTDNIAILRENPYPGADRLLTLKKGAQGLEEIDPLEGRTP